MPNAAAKPIDTISMPPSTEQETKQTQRKCYKNNPPSFAYHIKFHAFLDAAATEAPRTSLPQHHSKFQPIKLMKQKFTKIHKSTQKATKIRKEK